MEKEKVWKKKRESVCEREREKDEEDLVSFLPLVTELKKKTQITRLNIFSLFLLLRFWKSSKMNQTICFAFVSEL